jgi:parvulin-like peptidyl-prolyl isomerase
MRYPTSKTTNSRNAAALGAAFASLLLLWPAGCGRQGAPTVAGDANAPGAPAPVSLKAPDEHITAPIAVVNGTTVYASTYEEILEALREKIPSGDPDSVERYIGAKTLALQKAIDEELLYQEAVRTGHDPSDFELAQIYGDKVREVGTEANLLAVARNRKLSKSELLHSYRRAIAIDRFVKTDIESKLSATDEEVRAFYEMHPELFTPDTWLKVGQIFVGAPVELPAKKRAEALARIQGALEKMRQGRSFESLARDISEDGAGPEGGMIGFVKRGGLEDKLDRAVFVLKPGQVTGIVETDKGYHIMKVYESKGGTLESFDTVKDQVRQKLLTKKRGEALSGLISRLEGAAKIERLQA